MAKSDSSDIFMTLTGDAGPLEGESTTELKIAGRPPNELLNGFAPGRMFEITKFDFGVGVEQQAVEAFEYPGLAQALASIPGMRPGMRIGPRPGALPKRPPRNPNQPRPSLDESPVTVQPITFSRPMDKASHLLLHHTIARTFFRSAALVKRKSAGGNAAGEPYLRMDFKGVLLIDASWSDGEPIEETYTFHARAITMRYRPQLPDGSLGAAKVGFWSMVPNEREAPL